MKIIMLLFSLVLFACSCSSSDDPVASTSQELRVIADPTANPPCFAGLESNRDVCRAAGEPSTYAFAGACLRDLPPPGAPRNNLFGPGTGGGVPYLRAGPRPTFIAYCRGARGDSDIICCQ
jgi:hypothetical protein